MAISSCSSCSSSGPSYLDHLKESRLEALAQRPAAEPQVSDGPKLDSSRPLDIIA